MATLDLKPFGVNFVLRPGINTISDIDWSHLATGVSLLSYPTIIPSDFFRVNGKKYNNLKYLGAGSYGTTYRGTGPNGKQYAIKHIKGIHSQDDITSLLKESIQQIIVVQHTKDLENGPFAPILYGIGLDLDNGEAFIVSELMENTIWNFISSQTKEENDDFIPKMLTHISKNLNTLQVDLKFNHRDLKTDNVMYTLKPDNTMMFRFIDFGFTCLTWNGMFINGGGYFKNSPTCFRITRDIVQFITSILWFHKNFISSKLRNRLGNIISTTNHGKTDKLTQYMNKWTNSYKYLDSNNYVIEAGKPNIVYDEMVRFVNGKPFKGTRFTRKGVKRPAPAVSPPAEGIVDICPPEKIMNPATRRCVLRTGAIGRKLEKELAVPAAVPAVPAVVPAAASDGCPPGKIRNPKTRRCVKRDGAIGKKLP